jgi:tetratricopeptide (TPR) repeat protein
MKSINSLVTLLETILEFLQQAEKFLIEAQIEDDKDKYQEALRINQQALNIVSDKLSPAKLAVLNQTGRIYATLKDFENAAHYFNLSLELYYNNKSVIDKQDGLGFLNAVYNSHKLLGDIYFYHKKDPSKAIEHLEASIKIQEQHIKNSQQLDDANLYLSFAYNSRAEQYIREKNFKDAMADSQKDVEISIQRFFKDPDNASNKRNLGIAHRMSGYALYKLIFQGEYEQEVDQYFQKSLNHLNQAIILLPEDLKPDAIRIKCLLLFYIDKPHKVLSFVTELLRTRSNNDELEYFKIKAKFLLADTSQEKALLQKQLDGFIPADSDIDKSLKSTSKTQPTTKQDQSIKTASEQTSLDQVQEFMTMQQVMELLKPLQAGVSTLHNQVKEIKEIILPPLEDVLAKQLFEEQRDKNLRIIRNDSNLKAYYHAFTLQMQAAINLSLHLHAGQDMDNTNGAMVSTLNAFTQLAGLIPAIGNAVKITVGAVASAASLVEQVSIEEKMKRISNFSYTHQERNEIAVLAAYCSTMQNFERIIILDQEKISRRYLIEKVGNFKEMTKAIIRSEEITKAGLAGTIEANKLILHLQQKGVAENVSKIEANNRHDRLLAIARAMLKNSENFHKNKTTPYSSVIPDIVFEVRKKEKNMCCVVM